MRRNKPTRKQLRRKHRQLLVRHAGCSRSVLSDTELLTASFYCSVPNSLLRRLSLILKAKRCSFDEIMKELYAKERAISLITFTGPSFFSLLSKADQPVCSPVAAADNRLTVAADGPGHA